jgi:hypothetical protein
MARLIGFRARQSTGAGGLMIGYATTGDIVSHPTAAPRGIVRKRASADVCGAAAGVFPEQVQD